MRFVSLLWFFWPFLLPAQAPVDLPPGAPQLHLVHRTDPMYPAIARSAHLTGTVTVHIDIAEDGSVRNAKALSGPAMLAGAALDCVQHWQYEPVQVGGKVVPATTIVLISFSLTAHQGDPALDAGQSAVQACMQAVSSKEDPASQVQFCQAAVDAAEVPPLQTNFPVRFRVFTYASTAYRHDKQYKEALAYADRALEAAEKAPEGQSTVVGAYDTRAQAEAESGDLQAASADLTKAEELAQTVVDNMRTAGHGDGLTVFRSSMKSRFLYHAQVLRALGKTADAEAKAAEAAKL